MAVSSIHTGWGYRANGGRQGNTDISAYYAGTEVVRTSATAFSFRAGVGVTITDTGLTVTAGGVTVNGGNVTVADNLLLGIGTGNTARFSWGTTDANANELLLQMPAGGAVDVPVLAIGQSIESVDLGLFNGLVDPNVALFGVGAVATSTVLRMYKTRGSLGTPTVITTGDNLGQISAYGYSGAGGYVEAAQILLDSTGTIATTRVAGVIELSTGTDAAPTVLTSQILFSGGVTITVADNQLFRLGTTGDGVLVNSSAGVAADTALGSVLIGTVVAEAVAANSLLISNVTASGDIAMYGNRGGNSEQFLFMDVSAGVLYLSPVFGGLMLAMAADPPAPDGAGVHIWEGTAGVIGANAVADNLVVEGTGNVGISILAGNASQASLYFGDDGGNTDGGFEYTHGATPSLAVRVAGANFLVLNPNIAWAPVARSATPGTTGGIQNIATSTFTDNNTAGSGTAAAFTAYAFQAPTLAASNASVTTTDAATVYISAAVIAGTNETLTNAMSLWCDAGTAGFDAGVWLGTTRTAAALVSTASSGAGTTTHYIGNQTITTSSDMRVKTAIVTWEGSALSLLRQAHVVEFNYNLPGGGSQEEGYGPNARGRYVGMLAQETIRWAPWIVNAGAGRDCTRCQTGLKCGEHEEFWFVEYQHLVPLVVRGVQEIDLWTTQAEMRFSTLEERMDAVEEAERHIANGWLKEQVREAMADGEFKTWLKRELMVA